MATEDELMEILEETIASLKTDDGSTKLGDKKEESNKSKLQQ
jgi:hypothetical protein